MTNAHLFDRPVFNGAGCNANVLNSLVFAAVLGLFSVVGGCAVTESVQDAPVAAASTNVSRAERIHDKVLVLDAHADIEYADAPSRYALPNGVSRVAPTKLQAGKVDAVVMAVAVGPGPRDAQGYAAARATADK